MRGYRRLEWLALTPEPERELPRAVSTLRRSSEPDERRRVERLVLHGTQRGWLRYLAEVAELVTAAAADPTTDVVVALTATEVVLDHHRMLIGLPGPGYRRAAAARGALEQAIAVLRTRATTGDGARSEAI